MLVCPREEAQIDPDQQHFIDDHWMQFLNTGDTKDEKGYMLNAIPGRLHVDWNQSALLDREGMPPVNLNASASADAILAEPVMPSSPSPSREVRPDRSRAVAERDESPASVYGAHGAQSSSSSSRPAPSAAKSSQPPSTMTTTIRPFPYTDIRQRSRASTDRNW